MQGCAEVFVTKTMAAPVLVDVDSDNPAAWRTLRYFRLAPRPLSATKVARTIILRADEDRATGP